MENSAPPPRCTIVSSQRPPTRGSIRIRSRGASMCSGPYHSATSSGSVQALNTRARGASKMRVMRLITRIFEAPRARVFRAWTDPDEVAEWYGPEHMDAPRERIRIDPRVGGRWELTMVQRGGGAEFSIGYVIIEL